MDRDSVHRSRKVRAWLADQVELHLLPPYSPELVNADLKRSLPMSSRARGQAELAAEADASFVAANVSPTSSAGTSAIETSATPSTRTN